MTGPRTVVLNASPRPAGNCMALVGAMTEELGGAVSVVNLYERRVAPCRACLACDAGGMCPIIDDMPGIVRRLGEAHFLIMASPLHFTSLTAPLVAFISRLQPVWRRTSRGGIGLLPAGDRLGALVVTAGSRYPGMFGPARAVAMAAFNSLSIHCAGIVEVADTDRIPAVENAGAMAEAKRLAANMLERAGKE